MISLFRNFARSKWAVGLLAIVALSLLITGGSQMDVLGALQPPRVISAGDRSLDAREFQLAVEQVRNNIQREQGQAPKPEEFAARFRGPLEVVTYPGAHHTLEFEAPDHPWLGDVVRWLEQRL